VQSERCSSRVRLRSRQDRVAEAAPEARPSGDYKCQFLARGVRFLCAKLCAVPERACATPFIYSSLRMFRSWFKSSPYTFRNPKRAPA
jgi:hypothetical protein